MENSGLVKINFHRRFQINLSVSATEKIKRLFAYIGVEPIIWIAAFVFLAIHDPYTQNEFSICPLKALGFHYCPGCGLGRSISFLLHGDLVSSFQAHIFGIPATIILFSRTVNLLSKTIKQNKPSHPKSKELPWRTSYN